MKRRRLRKTTEIEVETQETLAIQRGKPTAWCPGCAQESAMDTPEGAARLAGVSVRKMYQWVEAGEVHFNETAEGTLICLSSLMRLRKG